MAEGVIAQGLQKLYTTHKRKGWFRYTREEKFAVRGLDLAVAPGQIVGLLGLNGAGKTTTIKMLSTLLLPTAGTVHVDGLDSVRDVMAVRQRINMIAGGERMIYWRLTGRENLWYFAQLYDVEPRQLGERLDGLLRLVGLEEAADTPVERYSKGMKQRLQIARGLINDPKYLFMDEPTLGLDAPIARELRSTIKRFAVQGKGILLTSHYLVEVEELCSYIYIIDSGGVVAAGSANDLKRLTRQDRVVRVISPELPGAVSTALRSLVAETNARMDVRTATDNEVIVEIRHPEDLTGRIAAAVTLNGGSIQRLELVEPTLEDALLRLTERNTEGDTPHAAVGS